MTHYFFDEQDNKLIAYDADTKALRELVSVALGAGEPAAVEAVVPKPERSPASPASRRWNGQQPRPAAKAQAGCDECGSLGRRHKKGCALASATGSVAPKNSGGKDMGGTPEWQALGEVEAPANAKRMSRMTFGRVKISQSHDIPVDTIARNIEEPESEVEKAFDAENYDEFLRL
jgi:hypothetical protein